MYTYIYIYTYIHINMYLSPGPGGRRGELHTTPRQSFREFKKMSFLGLAIAI